MSQFNNNLQISSGIGSSGGGTRKQTRVLIVGVTAVWNPAMALPKNDLDAGVQEYCGQLWIFEHSVRPHLFRTGIPRLRQDLGPDRRRDGSGQDRSGRPAKAMAAYASAVAGMVARGMSNP